MLYISVVVCLLKRCIVSIQLGNPTNGGYCNVESTPSAMYKSKKLISKKTIEKLTDAIQVSYIL